MRQLLVRVACSRLSWPRCAAGLCTLLVVLLSIAPATFAQEVRYVYDAAGRLIAVIDAQGRATIYDYDEAGNLLAVRRPDVTTTVAITYVSPTAGLPGDVVDIFGVGFIDTAAGNQVAFNGTPAQVTSATTTRLTVTVPAGATTGLISVSNQFGSAASPSPFVIPTMTIAPTAATVALGRQRQFAITLSGLADRRATWSVNGIVGGALAFGTITPDGLFTAPNDWPPSADVLVQARAVAFPALVANAAVVIVPPSVSVIAAPVDLRLTRPGLGDPGGLAANVTVAPPPHVSVVRPGMGDAGGLPLNVIAATPPHISIVRPTLGGTDGLGLNVTVGRPPFITVVVPSVGELGLGLNVVVGLPPHITVTMPGTGSTGGNSPNVIVAQPHNIRVGWP
jgi:YD repeat-containing protein